MGGGTENLDWIFHRQILFVVRAVVLFVVCLLVNCKVYVFVNFAAIRKLIISCGCRSVGEEEEEEVEW